MTQLNDFTLDRSDEKLETRPAHELYSQLIQEINRRIGNGSSSGNILNYVFDSLSSHIPYDRIGIALIEEKTKRIRLNWVKSRIPSHSLTKNYSAEIAGSGLEKIIETGEPRIIGDLDEYSRQHPQSLSTKLILNDGIRSSLTCPLRVGNKTIGVVFFSSVNPLTYEKRHVDFFLAITDEIALILKYAELENYFSQHQSKEKVLSHILHDLRSPLSVITGYLEILKDKNYYPGLPGEVQNICKVLERNATNMLFLLEELVDLRKEVASGSAVEAQKVNLNQFILQIVDSAEGMTEAKEIKFEYAVIGPMPECVEFDPVKIERVLQNLIGNAVKFSDRGKTVVLSIKILENRIEFSVADHGHGIAADEISQLFTEFGKTTTRPTEGEPSTGLGLAIAKSLVEQHGGQIFVASELNRGSVFTFWIPRRTTFHFH